MDLTFFPLTLDAIDQAAAESLCLFVASDERPLTGLAGLVDWRLTARLSKLVRGGQLTGEAGEAVLTSPGPRLAFRKMFLFGIGPSDQSDEQLQTHVAEPPPQTPTRPGRKPVPPPPQRYVPAEPKQNVFKKKKR